MSGTSTTQVRNATNAELLGELAYRNILVWDVARGEMVTVDVAEAAAGMVRYARSLGPGSAACGQWERRALELMAEQD